MHHLDIRTKGSLVIMDIKANAFLQHMVRNVAGVLMAVGSGKQPVSWVEEVLNHRNRTLGGVTASPAGLYFMNVDYPAEHQIPLHRVDIPSMPL